MTRMPLSPLIKRALIVLLRDRFVRLNHSGWYGKSRQVIHPTTIEAMAERRLIYLSVYAEGTGCHRARLTEAGRLAATACEDEARAMPPPLPEESAQFIAEIMS